MDEFRKSNIDLGTLAAEAKVTYYVAAKEKLQEQYLLEQNTMPNGDYLYVGNSCVQDLSLLLEKDDVVHAWVDLDSLELPQRNPFGCMRCKKKCG